MSDVANLPLAGVKVLDLSRILAGPFCTQILSDLGAEVVKVERPGTGDDTRQWGPPFITPVGDAQSAEPQSDGQTDRGTSAYFASCNRGKRSLALDLSTPAGRAVLDDLIRAADVLLENFLPDAVAKLGLEPARLRELNPRLVSCSISGFGRTGPLAGVPGYDLAIQAGAGLMSITGEPEGMPMKVGVAMSDVLTGLYAAVSVLAGLFGREQGRPTSGFDVALADCTLAALVNVAQSTLVTGKRPQRWGNAHSQIVPYEAFATSDGHLVLAVGADRQWGRLCRLLGREAWIIDPRFRTNPDRVANRDELLAALRPLFQVRPTDAWLADLAAAEVPHARIAAIDEALASPQTAARAMVQTFTDASGRAWRLLGNPIHWHDRPATAPLPPPELGADTKKILVDWLHYKTSHIDGLLHDGVIA